MSRRFDHLHPVYTQTNRKHTFSAVASTGTAGIPGSATTFHNRKAEAEGSNSSVLVPLDPDAVDDVVVVALVAMADVVIAAQGILGLLA